MHIFILFAHPIRDSFTGNILDKFIKGAEEAGHSVDLHDLYRSNFQTIMTGDELVRQFAGEPVPEDVRHEQLRYERCDAMVMVFPVWWWSIPAILKGWIERVFTAGWAYPIDKDDPSTTLMDLENRKGLLIGCGGASEKLYAEQGNNPTVKRMLARGTFGYFGADLVETHIFYGARTSVKISEAGQARRAIYLKDAYDIGRKF